MQATSGGPKRRHGIGSLLLFGLVLATALASLPGTTARREAVPAENASFLLVRTGLSEPLSWNPEQSPQRNIVSGESPDPHAGETSSTRPELGASPNGTLDEAVRTYTAASNHVADTKRDLRSATADALEHAMGQLAAGDEAALLEPLVSMRDAEAAFVAGAHSLEQLAEMASLFSARLEGLAIPGATRARLAAKMSDYERELSEANNALTAERQAEAALRTASLAVHNAVDTADRILAIGRDPIRYTSPAYAPAEHVPDGTAPGGAASNGPDETSERGWWLPPSLLVTACAAFLLGRATLPRRTA